MKIINRIILVIIGGLFQIILQAQSNPLDGMIKKYADQPGFYFLEMKTNIFSSFTNDNTAPSANKIITVKMLTYKQDSSSKYKSSEIYEQFNSNIDLGSYKGLVEVLLGLFRITAGVF